MEEDKGTGMTRKPLTGELRSCHPCAQRGFWERVETGPLGESPPHSALRKVGCLYTPFHQSLLNFPHLLPAPWMDKEDVGGQRKLLGTVTKASAWVAGGPLVH